MVKSKHRSDARITIGYFDTHPLTFMAASKWVHFYMYLQNIKTPNLILSCEAGFNEKTLPIPLNFSKGQITHIMQFKEIISLGLAVLLAFSINLKSNAATLKNTQNITKTTSYTSVLTSLRQQNAAISTSPSLFPILPASGEVKQNEYVTIDYGHADNGYVLIRYNQPTDEEVRVYIYNGNAYDAFILNPNSDWTTIALSDGDGAYTIKVMEHAYDGLFWSRLNFDLEVSLKDPLSPYLLSNYNIDFSSSPNATSIAQHISRSCTTTKETVDTIQSFVAAVLSFDHANQDSYQWYDNPDLDEILERRNGVCKHYSILMCGMLRSLGIPAKMEYGYLSNGNYHAWISAYIPNKGWVRYDPSLISVCSSNSISWARDYISNDSNYIVTKTF